MIGFYVHHHGTGHATRACAVAQHVDDDVVGLGTDPAPPGWPGAWERLPDDSAPGISDPTASGRLHWVPSTAGVRARAAALSGAVARHRPHLLVADVSVEATLLARLHGVPVVVVGQPGVRDDRAHALGHDVAELLLLPWPRSVGEEPWRTRTATPVLHVGAVSRFDDRTPGPRPGDGTVLVLLGSGGHALDGRLLVGLARQLPDRHVRVLGDVRLRRPAPDNLTLDGWVADPWDALVGADVVLAHAGQNVVADVAAARRPAVLLPQDRPYDEQHHLATVLARHGLAEVARDDDDPLALAQRLRRADGRDGDEWSRWHDGEGARRAAAVVTGLVRERAAA